MADTKISAATLTTPQTTDLIPLARGGSSVARHATVAAIVQAQAASTTAVGSVELATAAETQAGTSSTLAVTPAGYSGAFLASLGIYGLAFDYYVDSVGGDDTNSGTTVASPLKTIAALTAKGISAGDRIGLKRGSHWDESLVVAAANIEVRAYGRGAKPVLDCSEAVENAYFSKTSGRANVYEAAVTIESGVTTWVSAWEDDTRLTRAATLAACDTTAGSYYPSSDSTDNITLYIHATDSSSVITNGKVYEYSKRQNGFYSRTVEGVIVENIHTRRNLQNDGSLAIGPNSAAYGCVATEGTKHNILCGTGCYLYECDAIDAYYGSDYYTLFVANEDTPAYEGVIFEKCRAILNQYEGLYSTGIYGHYNTSGGFGTIKVVDCEIRNCSTGSSFTNFDYLIYERCKFDNNAYDIAYSQAAKIDIIDCQDNNDRHSGNFINGSVDGATILIRGLRSRAIDCTPSQGILLFVRSGTYTVRNCSFRIEKAADSTNVMWIENAGAVISATYNVYDVPNNATGYIYANISGTLTSDYNHYFQTSRLFFQGGTGYANLAAWQAASSQDANSTSG